MDIISLIIILVVLAVVIIVITRPFFKNQTIEAPAETPVVFPGDQTEYQEILARIRDLDFEYKLGKIPVDDYGTLRDELKAQAAGVVQSASDQKPGN